MQNSIKIIQNALDTLQLPQLITKDDIKKQYRYLSKKRHPDLGGDIKEFQKVNKAHKLIKKEMGL